MSAAMGWVEDSLRLHTVGEGLERERERLATELAGMKNVPAERDPQKWLLNFYRRDKMRLLELALIANRNTARVTTLLAAVDGLHSASDRDGVLAAIHDVVMNLIGAEEVAVFELSPRGSTLHLISSVGVDPAPLVEVGFGEGVVGRVAGSGRLFVNQDEPRDPAPLWEETITACIPLKLAGRLTGVIAIFAVQPDKTEFTPLDFELFEALSKHAAIALSGVRRP